MSDGGSLPPADRGPHGPENRGPQRPENRGPQRPVRSVDVAAHAGVSQATVSRVLSGKTSVSDKTRAVVLAALEELGYQPNINARALKTQRTRSIAVVVADITNPFYPELVEALSEELAAEDQTMLLWNDASNGDDGSVVAAMLQGLVDGAIFATATDDSPTLVKARELDLPIALVNRRIDQSPFDSVTSDNANGGRIVADYLAEHGRQPALIAGPRNASTSSERSAGFLERWSTAGHGPPPHVRYTDFSYDSGAAFCADMMALDEPPNAIFATNDYTAFGVLDMARRLGVAVPEDLWVIGYDDIAMAGWTSMDLTTVRQPTAEMAAAAVRLLLQRLDDRDRPIENVKFGSELVIRGSTGGETSSA